METERKTGEQSVEIAIRKEFVLNGKLKTFWDKNVAKPWLNKSSSMILFRKPSRFMVSHSPNVTKIKFFF